MSKHSSFADDMPELYPNGTAQQRDDQIDRVGRKIDLVLAAKKKPLTARDKYDLLKAAGFEVGWRDKKVEVFIPSPVAPELDSWIILEDDPVLEERTLDSAWES